MPLPEIPSHSLTCNGVTVWYRTLGQAESPPCLFIHGWGSRISSLKVVGNDAVIHELANYFQVIAPEMPGLMRSDDPPADWGFDQYADCLIPLMDHLRLHDPVVIGQSFGGAVATAFAARHPDRLSHLVLVDAVLSNQPKNAYYWTARAVNHLTEQTLRAPWVPFHLKQRLASWFFGTPESCLKPDDIQGKIRMCQVMRTLWPTTDYRDLDPGLPISLLWGNKDVFVTPLRTAQEANEALPNASLRTVKGNHLALYAHPEKMVQEIIRLITQQNP